MVNAGAFAQEQLGFNDFVFLTAGGRLDRNSAFGAAFGAVFYPKASISVIPSDLESWTSALLSTVRLRAAVGQSGLQPGAFDKFTTFAPEASEFGPALVADNLGNDSLKPERATEWEVGAEVGLFDDRLSVDVTYWDRVTKDALYNRQFPPSGGFVNEQIINIGQLDAKGLEVSVAALIFNRPNLSLRFFGNASYLDEIVTDLGGSPPLKVGGAYVRYRNWVDEGYAPGAYFGTMLASYPSGSTPFDLNGDGTPDTEAEMLAYFAVPRTLDDISGSSALLLNLVDGNKYGNYLGKPIPDWQGSFGFNLGFLGNFELSSLFEYKFGEYFVHNLTDAFRATHPGIGRNFQEATEVELALENPASTPEERLAAAMKFASELKHLDPRSGLNAVRKADFLRWRELSLTYRVPAAWARSLFGIRYLTLNASVRNLKLWTGYDGIDPETNLLGRNGGLATGDGQLANNFGYGIDAWGIPLQRRFTFTVRFGI